MKNKNNTKPLVSIACITFNHVNYIQDAIKGFLIQKTDFPFEIIIHDDASIDGTSDIIRKYSIKYPSLISASKKTTVFYQWRIKNVKVEAGGRSIDN